MLGGSRRPPRVPSRLPGASDHPSKNRRLHLHMAKKRVHELAKQYDMPSSEVMKRLQAYGLEVKAAATAVDTELADAALTGKPKPKASQNGAKKKQEPSPPAHTGVGFDRPAPRAPRPAANAPDTQPKPADGQPDGGDRAKRPTRSSLQGERAPGSGGGVRRVVIDSQASRRQGPGGGPGGPGGGPGGGPPQRPPRRRGGRRRRGTYEAPEAQDVSVLKADVIRVNS